MLASVPELDGRRSSGIAKALADMTPEQRAALQQQKGILQVGGGVSRAAECLLAGWGLHSKQGLMLPSLFGRSATRTGT